MPYVERYASPSGAGLHDGSSEANAWTYLEALNNVSPGDRVNLKAGTYPTVTNNNQNVNTAGTVGNPIHFRGYKTSIGDLDDLPLDGLADGVDLPYISHTGSIGYTYSYQSNYNWTHLSFHSDQNNRPAVYLGGAATQVRFVRMNNSGGADALRSSSHCFFYGCEMSQTHPTINSYALITSGNHQSYFGCKFIASTLNNRNSFTASNTYLFVDRCLFINGKVGVEFSSGNNAVIKNNVFYGVTAGVKSTATATSTHAVVGNIFHSCTKGVEYTNPVMVRLLNNSFYNVTTNVDVASTYGVLCDVESTTLSTDPFVDAASHDFTPVSGASIIGSGHPKELNGVTNNRTNGAISIDRSSSSSSVVPHPLMSN